MNHKVHEGHKGLFPLKARHSGGQEERGGDAPATAAERHSARLSTQGPVTIFPAWKTGSGKT